MLIFQMVIQFSDTCVCCDKASIKQKELDRFYAAVLCTVKRRGSCGADGNEQRDIQPALSDGTLCRLQKEVGVLDCCVKQHRYQSNLALAKLDICILCFCTLCVGLGTQIQNYEAWAVMIFGY